MRPNSNSQHTAITQSKRVRSDTLCSFNVEKFHQQQQQQQTSRAGRVVTRFERVRSSIHLTHNQRPLEADREHDESKAQTREQTSKQFARSVCVFSKLLLESTSGFVVGHQASSTQIVCVCLYERKCVVYQHHTHTNIERVWCNHHLTSVLRTRNLGQQTHTLLSRFAVNRAANWSRKIISAM